MKKDGRMFTEDGLGAALLSGRTGKRVKVLIWDNREKLSWGVKQRRRATVILRQAVCGSRRAAAETSAVRRK